MRTRLISVKADRLSPIELASSERDIDPFSSKASIMFTYEEVATATGRPPLPSAGRDDPADLATRLPFCLAVAMQQNTSTPEPFCVLLESSLPLGWSSVNARIRCGLLVTTGVFGRSGASPRRAPSAACS